MKRLISSLALLAFCSCFVVPASQAEVCVSPRIKKAKACGVVIDPFGMPIPRATVRFGAAGSEPTVTDFHGRFSAAAQGDEVRMHVEAIAFGPIETTIGTLAPAPATCKKPLFVMLALGTDSCAMISLRKSDLVIAKKD